MQMNALSTKPLGEESFVGRQRELSLLLDSLERATLQRGGVELLAGEPGIGKTRLCREVASQAQSRGVHVLWGRSWESGGAPTYWPWRQVLEQLVATTMGDAERASLSASSLLREFVPLLEKTQHRPDEAFALTPGPEAARFALFEEITRLIRKSSELRPLLIVIEDLHAADVPTLLLLKFVAREIRDASVLIIANFRDLEARQREDVAAALGDVAREGNRLPLTGWSEGEVSEFLQLGGTDVPHDLARSIAVATSGNPLFVKEMLRLIRSLESIDAVRLPVPEGVREALRNRLSMLSESAKDLLAVASVIGRDFDLGMIDRVCGIASAQALDLLEEGQRAAVLEESSTGRFRFSHGLVAQCLYEELSPSRRMGIHREIGEALEGLVVGEDPRVFAEIARHFCESAHIGTADKAVHYGMRAAELASQQLGFEEASRIYGDVLHALERAGSPEGETAAEVLLAKGVAEFHAGHLDRARTTLERAAAVAAAAERPDVLARAALALPKDPEVGTVDQGQVEMLEQALKLLGEKDHPLTARVLARLGRVRYWDPAPREGEFASRRGLEIARRLGEDDVLAAVLPDRHVAIWGPDTLEERLHIADEIIARARRAKDGESLLEGLAWRMVDKSELGDFAAVARDLREFDEGASALGQPHYLWRARLLAGSAALFEGRFDEAEKLAEEAFNSALNLGDPSAFSFYLPLITVLRHAQGRLVEVEAMIVPALAAPAMAPMIMPVAAGIHAESGRLDEARELLRSQAATNFSEIPRNNGWLAFMIAWAEAAWMTGESEIATTLYERLKPYSGRFVAGGRVMTGTFGPITRHLGLLALAMGHAAPAVDHFEHSLHSLEAAGVVIWRAQSHVGLGEALLQRKQSKDRELALENFAKAFDLSRELEMDRYVERLLERFHEFGLSNSEIARVIAKPEPEADDVPTRARLTSINSSWEVEFAGTVVRVKDTKGMRYLRELLQHPGRELHALELSASLNYVRATGPTIDRAESLAPVTDGGAFLDSKAKAAYRLRLQHLQEEIDEADAFGNRDEVARLTAEMEAIASELARSLGLGGRDRKASSDAERARVSVTKAIRSAMKALAEVHPELGAHLERSVKTGFFCAYDPPSRVEWGS